MVLRECSASKSDFGLGPTRGPGDKEGQRAHWWSDRAKGRLFLSSQSDKRGHSGRTRSVSAPRSHAPSRLRGTRVS